MTVSEIAEAAGGKILNDNPYARITHVSTDSRDIQRGKTLFVPVIGEKTDAHRFLPDVERDEAAAALVSEDIDPQGDYVPGCGGMAVIRVRDTVEALQDIACACRKKISIPLIGVTGSVGKTTTREMTALALSAGLRVFRTSGNHNSQIGVPLTLFDIADTDEAGVIEMGMSFPGEMTKLSRMVRPAGALLTNIGIAHIAQLKTRENIRTEKLHIQDYMPEGGTLFVNGDDDLLRDLGPQGTHELVFYGTDPARGNYADHIEIENGCAAFDAHLGARTVHTVLRVYGRHQILNAMAALSVADRFGVDPEAAAEKLSGFRGFSHRQQIFENGGITVIDDTYNASPVSMKAAIDILAEVTVSGRKIAVLADMKELGPEEERFHYEIGTYLASRRSADCIFLLGKLAEKIADGVRDAEGPGGRTEIFQLPDQEALLQALRDYVRPGDAVLLKGSNSMKLSPIADRLSNRTEQAEHAE